jgi:DNA-directed RNA polymerase specialized sigma24 family protein
VNWARLYTEHRVAMLDVAARRVQDRPDLDASDVVQEVFVALLADPPRTAVPDWRDLLVRLTATASLGGETPPVEEGLPEEDTAAIVVRRGTAEETRRRMQRVMSYMTERQREVTRLRLFEGFSVGEIAARINTSSSNVSQIVTRCLAKLGPSLAGGDGFDEHDLEQLRPPRRASAPRPPAGVPVEDSGRGREAMAIPQARKSSQRPAPGWTTTPAPTAGMPRRAPDLARAAASR